MARRSSIIRVDIIGDATDLSRALGEAEGKIGSFGTNLAQSGSAMTRNLTVPLAGLGAASVAAAAQLEESTGGIVAVLGEHADAIIRFGQTAAREVGLSANQVNELAIPLAAMLTNAGLDPEEAAQTTIDLIRSAADLGATVGRETGDAVEAITGAFKGEFDRLENFAITIRASQLGDLETETDRVFAIIEEINTQGEFAYGRFAAEADGLTGSLKITRAEAENTAATFGTELIPVTSDLANKVRDAVEAFGDMPDAAQSAIVNGALIVAALGPIIFSLGQIIRLATLIPGSFAGIAASVGTLAAAAGTLQTVVSPGSQVRAIGTGQPVLPGGLSQVAQLAAAVGDYLNEQRGLAIDGRAVEEYQYRRRAQTADIPIGVTIR